ncbi:MAG: pyridoxamine kinase [Oscillospiraceae bacterium]
MKRILTIQDFSCVGRCSLTVALPIISAAGVECCAVPTVLLSNHTGFPSFYSHDLSDNLLPIGGQLKGLGIDFSAIYTGYIASAQQLALIERLIDEFRRDNTLVLIDPVMGDNGKLYPALVGDFPERMRKLCRKADILVPNITEACLLTGREYSPTLSHEELRAMLVELHEAYGALVILTGVPSPDEPEKLGACSFDGREFCGCYTPKEPISCSGTGDIFSSALLGAYLRGLDLNSAMSVAVRFTYECVRLTCADPDSRFYGVNFEQALPLYIRLLEESGVG